MSVSRRNFIKLTSATALIRFAAQPLAITVFCQPARADGGLTIALAVGAVIANRIAAHNARSVDVILLKDMQKKIDLLLDGNLALLRGQEAIIRRLTDLPGEIAQMLEGRETAALIDRVRGVQTATAQVARLLQKNGHGYLEAEAPQRLVADALDELNKARNILVSTVHAYKPAVLAIATTAAQADLMLLNLRNDFETGWSKVAEDLIDEVYLPWFRGAVDADHPTGLPAYRRAAEADRKSAWDGIAKSRLGKPLFEGQSSVVATSILAIDEQPSVDNRKFARTNGADGGPGDLIETGKFEPPVARKWDRIWFDVSLQRLPVENTQELSGHLSDAGIEAVHPGTTGIEWLVLTANDDKPSREIGAPSANLPTSVPASTLMQTVDIPDDERRLQHMLQQPAWTNAKIEVAALKAAIETVNLASARIGFANQVEALVRQCIPQLEKIRRTYS